MFALKWTIITALLCLRTCAGNPDFPSDFIFGAGTSSYQIEGAANVCGKSNSIWDRYTHNATNLIRDGSNGDVACDSYHLWQKDVDAAAETGLDFYRFSISWPRLLPNAFDNKINEEGKNYYNRLIDGLVDKGIQPMITMYHWDLPQRLQDLGGWANPLSVDWFTDYARVIFSLYADRVKTWITMNEPLLICDMGYANIMAPSVSDLEVGRYLCGKHVLLAHAAAWRMYDEHYRPKYNGMISITNHVLWAYPLSKSEKYAAQLANEQMNGRFAHPIFSKEGGWPPILQKIIAEKSKEEGYPFSRLLEFTEKEKEFVKGTYDYFGLNYYTSRMVRMRRADEPRAKTYLDGDADMDFLYEINPAWKDTANAWFKQCPDGLRLSLQWIKETYGDLKVLITEVGFSTESDALEDHDRIQFFKDYMEQVVLSIKKDTVNVIGFTVWSLIDNFEWLDGYQAKFGLYAVNFTDPNRRRTPRLSSKFYANVIKHHSLDVPVV